MPRQGGQDRQDHDRAVGLPLLRRKGPQGEIRPRCSGDQTLFPARQYGRSDVRFGEPPLRPDLYRKYRRGARIPGRRADVRGHPRRQDRRPVLSRQLRPRGQAFGCLGDDLSFSRDKLGGDDIVLGSNNNNFVKGGEGEPTLISLDDASTLFHEFGHATRLFHDRRHLSEPSGTPRDFVEYPSQVNENWLMTPYVLQNYAHALPDRRSRSRRH